MKKLLILPILAVALILPGCGVTTRDGSHVGVITAIEKNGLMWQAYDVYVKTDKSSSQEDTYCVEDEDVIDALKEANKDGKRVEVIYHSELVVAPWRCHSSDTIIDQVKVLE